MAKPAKPSNGSTGLSRRRLLGGVLGIGVGLQLRPALAKDPDPRKLPPQPGDDLVRPSWDGDGRLVRIEEVTMNGPPLLVYPRDPASGIAREKSRLNQILLVRFAETELSAATKPDAAAGIVAYSGVCTHTGCSVTEWDTNTRNLLCPCHASQFDPRDRAKIIGGPATPPLPILPLVLAGDNLKVSAPFAGKLGGEKNLNAVFMKRITVTLLYLLAFLVPALAAAAPGYSPVTDERLIAPEDENWLMYRRTYDGWGYSPLTQIDTGNVKSLVPVWTFSTGVEEGHQAPPIVNNGVMFVSTPQNQVLAIDVKTGELIWRYRRELPDDLLQLHPTNRGVALHGDRVYLATVDAFLVALNAATGEVVWEAEVEDYLSGYYMTMAPLIAKGKVMVGVSGGEMGIRGFVAAFEVANGEPAWKTYTIPGPGEPGNDSWPGDTWKHGGVPVWLTGNYDPATGLAYWGTGNAGPWVGATRAGDNLHASSVIALDVATGKLEAHHQYHWNDSWDWDEVSPPLLIDVERGGKTIKALVHAGRNGYLWLLDRAARSIRFVDAQPFVRQNVFTGIDAKTGRPTYDPDRIPAIGKTVDYCPSLWGGKNWPPSAYNPKTGLLYIPANENLCARFSATPAQYRPGELYMGVALSDIEVYPHADSVDHIGELQAWDLATGKRKWTAKFPQQLWAPVLTTGGGLVFAGGTNDRNFRAFDAATGEILWQQRTNSGVTGVPTSFAVDGVQYIAVQSGWGVDAERGQAMLNASMGTNVQVPQGGVLWVFALPQ